MKIKYPILSVAVLFLLVILLGIFVPRNRVAKEQIFSVERGQNLFQIGQNLRNKKLINNRFLFYIYVFSNDAQHKLKAGQYRLSPSENIAQIARKIITGDIAKITVVIPEGFTKKQIEEKLGLELPDSSQGYLFPDTYYFPLNITGEEAAKIMQNNFWRKTADLKITPEIITMASILEREVKTKEDKALVSGILWKRMKVGMPLQVDAAPETYQKTGLPENPIANPGLESILATLSPKESPYWYYLSTPDGKTIFSRTLAEHNLAKAKYLTR